MKYSTNEETKFVKWLKRIFSIQTLSFIVAVIAAIISYKMYKASQPSQISIEYIDESDFWNYNTKNMRDDITGFVFYMPSQNNVVYWKRNLANGLLLITNKTDKSIRNLNLEIEIAYDNLILDLEDINSDFIVVKNKTFYGNEKILTLRYKYEILNPQSTIPLPIGKMHLPQSNDDEFYLSFDYKITYDGIVVPTSYYVENWVYRRFNRVTISQYLDKCYKEYRAFNTNERKSFIAVAIPKKMLEVNPPSNLTDEKFEEYKASFLQNVQNITESK